MADPDQGPASPAPGAANQPEDSVASAPLPVLLFAAGFTALVYELCWIRLASLVFGTSLYALSTVVAVFMAGLAAGSAFFGKRSLQTHNPVQLFAKLQAILGPIGFCSLLLFGVLDDLHEVLYPAVLFSPLLLALCRLVLVAIVIFPACFLMGGALPLLCRARVQETRNGPAQAGFLYAISALGGAAGCVVCGLVLIPRLGILASLLTGGSVSLIAALLAWRTPAMEITDDNTGPELPARRGVVLACAFAVGFAALGAEVVWARFLSLILYNTALVQTLTLAAVLLGIGGGSVAAMRLSRRSPAPAVLFGLFAALHGIVLMVAMFLPASWWRQVLHQVAPTWKAAVPAGALFLAVFFSGACFPLAVRLVLRRTREAGRAVGNLAAANTAGGVCGALFIGFVILPVAGLHAGVLLVAAAAVASAVIAWTGCGERGARQARFALAGCAILAWFLVPVLAGTRLPVDYLKGDGQLLAHAEGLNATLSVVRQGGRTILEIDRLWQGEDKKNHQVMAAHLPAILHPGPKSVLVVGLGTGQTAAGFLRHPIERLDCVDIEPRLPALVREQYDARWMDDARVRMIIEDGRNYLSGTTETYDIISLELGQTFRPGVASFYTTDFYERARRRLRPGGLLCQFVPLSVLDRPTFRTVIASFLPVFPDSVLWYNRSDLILVGRADGAIALTPDRLLSCLSDPAIGGDLDLSHWGGKAHRLNQPPVFLAGFLAGSAGLRELAGNVAPYRDDRPYLEYAIRPAQPVAPDATVALLREHLEPVGAVFRAQQPPAWAGTIEQVRQKNLADILAVAMRRPVRRLQGEGRHDEAAALLKESLALNPESLRSQVLWAEELVRREQHTEAMALFKSVIEQDPACVTALNNLGLLLHASGRTDLATIMFGGAVNADLTSPEARVNLGNMLMLQLRNNEALMHYRTAVEYAPWSAIAQYSLGTTLLETGKTDEGLECLEQLLVIEDVSANILRGAIRALEKEAPDNEKAQALVKKLRTKGDKAK